jgi:hypothetical protein
MKFLYALIFSFLCFFPQKSHALSCLATDFTPKVFDGMDFIAKGTVSKSWLNKLDPRHFGNIPFRLNVEKAWKGAKAGDEVTILYELMGGDDFPYQEGNTYIIYANNRWDGVLSTHGCQIYIFPKSPGLREFIQSPPYVGETDPDKLQHISNMRKQLEQLEEETLNEYSKGISSLIRDLIYFHLSTLHNHTSFIHISVRFSNLFRQCNCHRGSLAQNTVN